MFPGHLAPSDPAGRTLPLRLRLPATLSSHLKAAISSKSKLATPYFFRPTHKASGTSEKPSVSPTSHLITEFQIRSTTYEFSMLPSHSCCTQKNEPVILNSPEADEESASNPARC